MCVKGSVSIKTQEGNKVTVSVFSGKNITKDITSDKMARMKANAKRLKKDWQVH